VRFVVDDQAPTLATPVAATIKGDRILKLHYDDESSVVRAQAFVDDQIWSSASGPDLTVDLNKVSKGKHTLRLVAQDEAGNVYDQSIKVNVGGSAPAAGLLGALGALGLATGWTTVRRDPKERHKGLKG